MLGDGLKQLSQSWRRYNLDEATYSWNDLRQYPLLRKGVINVTLQALVVIFTVVQQIVNNLLDPFILLSFISLLLYVFYNLNKISKDSTDLRDLINLPIKDTIYQALGFLIISAVLPLILTLFNAFLISQLGYFLEAVSLETVSFLDMRLILALIILISISIYYVLYLLMYDILFVVTAQVISVTFRYFINLININ